MRKVHLICNAHIDPIWQWEWEEGASSALSTFQSAINLLKEYNYVFCHNEVNLYKYTERFAPALFEEIKKAAKEGKWKIMGGWYLQPDCLMPCGEGIVRQIQEGRIYFTNKFGYMPKTAINFDPFGHSRGLVQILKKCDQENYMFMRPMFWGQLDLKDNAFIWKGYDDSEVKGYRITTYGSNLGDALSRIKEDIYKLKANEDILAAPWGVGNHGGGPSRKDLSDINEFIKSTKDIEIVHSDPDSFFKEINPTFVYDESLIPCMAGCYTSMANLKQRYRHLENQLLFTEKIASIASLKGAIVYPDKVFRDVTEDMLNIQFHDILPGDMIKSGEENGLTYANHGLHLLNQVRADAFYGLIKGQEVAKENTYPILVFNPKTYNEEQYVECEMSIIRSEHYEDGLHTILHIYDEEGNEMPSQMIKESSNLTLDWRKRVIFKANLKPLSITRFNAVSELVPMKKLDYSKDVHIKNSQMEVKISSKSGLIEKLVVKGKDIRTKDFFRPYMYEDNADPWGMLHTEVGWNPEPFEKMEKPDAAFTGLDSFEITNDGNIYLACESFFAKGLTRVRIGYKIYKNEARIDIEVNVFPSEPDKVIKVHVPFDTKEILGEQIFGKEKLFMDGRECVSQNFIALKFEDNDEYLEIVKPSNYGSHYKDGVLGLTLLKTATYCAHPIGERPLLKEHTFIEKVDQGQRDFFFSIFVAKEDELKHNADIVIEKPYALNIFPTVDAKQDNGFEIKTNNPNISVITIKKALQTDGYLIRMQNCSENPLVDTITFGKAKIEVAFGKYEVKTLKYYDGKIEDINKMLI
ncbi:MAG: hypothetical protein IJ247_02075 [Bacilli bacterium]|nr:hypothetical protein [Bacilli bacterium]